MWFPEGIYGVCANHGTFGDIFRANNENICGGVHEWILGLVTGWVSRWILKENYRNIWKKLLNLKKSGGFSKCIPSRLCREVGEKSQDEFL